MKIDIKNKAEDLRAKFGDLAGLVCDELIEQAYDGYDYDAAYEVPFFDAVKEELKINQQQEES